MSDSTMTITGSLGRDPELKFTNGGRALCVLTVAVSHRWKDASDTWQEETAWVDATAWGPLAENVAASCTKGTRVTCVGRVKMDTWEDKEGQKRSKLTLVADEVAVSLRWARAEVERIERDKP